MSDGDDLFPDIPDAAAVQQLVDQAAGPPLQAAALVRRAEIVAALDDDDDTPVKPDRANQNVHTRADDTPGRTTARPRR